MFSATTLIIGYLSNKIKIQAQCCLMYSRIKDMKIGKVLHLLREGESDPLLKLFSMRC